jgi:hypothetical protein
MEFIPDFIPAWLLGVVIIYTGIAWLFPRSELCLSCKAIFASGFLIWGTVFGVMFELFPLDLETRGFISRTMILMICLSQSIPLTIFYVRRKTYAGRKINSK